MATTCHRPTKLRRKNCYPCNLPTTTTIRPKRHPSGKSNTKQTKQLRLGVSKHGWALRDTDQARWAPTKQRQRNTDPVKNASNVYYNNVIWLAICPCCKHNVGMRRRNYHKYTSATFSLYNQSTSASCYTSDLKNRSQYYWRLGVAKVNPPPFPRNQQHFAK